MKVLLADPPAFEKAYDASYPNLGILYLAGSLNKFIGKNNLKVEYLGPKQNLKSHLEYVRDFNPDIYGISFTSKTAELTYKTIKAVKEICPSIFIVCGGPHATALPQEVMEKSNADVCVVGEGEITLTELVNFLNRKEYDFRSIDGILYKYNDQIIQTNRRKFIDNLDEIPFPAWELIDFKDYPGMHLKKNPIESSLLVSRGCPYNCSFCSNPVWKSSKPWLRHRSISNICEEIELLYGRGVREIYMSSDEINFNENWAINLCKAILGLNHQDLYFQCNMRVDKVSFELAKSLKEINCWLVHLGIESANDRVLKGIEKHVSVQQVENASRTLSQAGVKVFAFMMLYQVWEEDGKLCFENNEEVDNSINFMKKLFKQRTIHYMSWQFCTPMPGARLYHIALKHNLFREDPEKIMEKFDEHYISLKLPGISEKEMRWRNKKGILLKDWYLIKSGSVNWKHFWRVKENLKAFLR